MMGYIIPVKLESFQIKNDSLIFAEVPSNDRPMDMAT